MKWVENPLMGEESEHCVVTYYSMGGGDARECHQEVEANRTIAVFMQQHSLEAINAIVMGSLTK